MYHSIIFLVIKLVILCSICCFLSLNWTFNYFHHIYSQGFKGCGNSFHGDGGGGSKLSQLRYSLRLLMSMCSTGDELVHQDLHEQGTIPLLLGTEICNKKNSLV